jgi:putative flippase GtrA
MSAQDPGEPEGLTQPGEPNDGGAGAQQADGIKGLVIYLWPRHRDKVMYLVVGAFNVIFSYGCFALLYYLLHDYVPAWGVVFISYMVQTVVGFSMMRYFVFAPASHPLLEYLRYQMVYVPLLLANSAFLALGTRYTDLSAYALQAIFAVPAIIGGYLGNKYFTFRKRKPAGQDGADT